MQIGNDGIYLIFRNLSHRNERAKGHIKFVPQVHRFGYKDCKGKYSIKSKNRIVFTTSGFKFSVGD